MSKKENTLKDIFEVAKKESQEIEHELNLKGLTKILCPECKGKGCSKPGYTDYDSYGEIYRDPTSCPVCYTNGLVEKPCGPQKQIAAINREIEKLNKKKEEIKYKLDFAEVKTKMNNCQIGSLYLIEDVTLSVNENFVALYLGNGHDTNGTLCYKWLINNKIKYSEPMLTNVIKKIDESEEK